MTTTDHPEPGTQPTLAAQPAPDDTTTGPVARVTTTLHARPHPGRHAAPEAAAERGTLSIDDSVIEKVAAAAAGEIDHVGGVARRVLGVAAGHEDGDHAPRVTARSSGELVALEIRLTVGYPASVRAVTEAVRAQVRDRVHTLTERTVSRVDISVAALTRSSDPSGAKRVVA